MRNIDSSTNSLLKSGPGVVLILIVVCAFAVRLGVRAWLGEENFWNNSYSIFYDLTSNVAAGKGFVVDYMGPKYAHRPPVYPIFLFLTMIGGKTYWPIVILQSAIGAGTVVCAFLIGRNLFSFITGVIAAMITALYPYYVMHDTALQETGLFTFLTALAIFLLLKSASSDSLVLWLVSGVALGAALLTRVTLSVFAPLVVLWVFVVSAQVNSRRLRCAATFLLGFLLLVTPWLVRNYLILGSPVLNSLTGFSLWAGNNPFTFNSYPAQSIDVSFDESLHSLRPEDAHAIENLENNEVAQDKYFANLAWKYVKGNPRLILRHSFTKVVAGFSSTLNPARGPAVQAVYLLSYGPVLVLGLAGMYLARRDWRTHSLIYALFLAFILVTTVFYAHTSHRSYLDIYLIVFSASVISNLGIHKFRNSWTKLLRMKSESSA